MRITNIEIVLSGRDNVFLQWRLEDQQSSPAQLETQIRFAYSEAGPWEVIAKGLRDTYYFRHTVNRRDRWGTPFYIIDVTDKELGVTVSSETVYPRHPPDGRALGLRTRLQQHLRGEYGVEVFFLKLRIEGEVDTATYDEVLGRPTGKRGSSFGHRYKGGYYAPMKLWAKIGIDPWILRSLSITGVAVNQSACWIASEPLLSPGDMIVERHTNRRWRIGRQVQHYARRQTLFRQACVLDQIPINDPEYDVAIEGV